MQNCSSRSGLNILLCKKLFQLLLLRNAYVLRKSAKNGGSRTIAGLVVLVPSCHCAFVGFSLVRNFFLVGISWVQNFKSAQK